MNVIGFEATAEWLKLFAMDVPINNSQYIMHEAKKCIFKITFRLGGL